MPTRNYQSIGEVLVSVKTEFPDITISKIRFLESEGLIEPERTPSGYRKFYPDDVERLMRAAGIPFIDSTTKSIEELATHMLHEAHLVRRVY